MWGANLFTQCPYNFEHRFLQLRPPYNFCLYAKPYLQLNITATSKTGSNSLEFLKEKNKVPLYKEDTVLRNFR